jgi:hypothetical protein
MTAIPKLDSRLVRTPSAFQSPDSQRLPERIVYFRHARRQATMGMTLRKPEQLTDVAVLGSSMGTNRYSFGIFVKCCRTRKGS